MRDFGSQPDVYVITLPDGVSTEGDPGSLQEEIEESRVEASGQILPRE